jgi:hypothetical protein
MIGVLIGTLPLAAPLTLSNNKAELRLQLLTSSYPGTPIFSNLGNIQLALQGASKRRDPAAMPPEDWQALRRRFAWPDGQSGVESPFSPYHAEDFAGCAACQPSI